MRCVLWLSWLAASQQHCGQTLQELPRYKPTPPHHPPQSGWLR